MILALHQPYFFPYIGYFSLIHAADVFMFFDNVQYVRKSWMKRNRILKPGREDVQYINVGLKKPYFKSRLPDCELHGDNKWKIRILAQLEHYKKKAPYYRETTTILENILGKNEPSLLEFNIKSITSITSLLKIDTPFELFSNIESEVEIADEPGIWGLNTSLAYGADTYVNAPGGEDFFPKSVFQNKGIKLGFLQPKLTPYNQRNKNFFNGLSIIDVLMFNGVKKTSEMIKEYTIKWI